jgi:putative two-component system response regulator
MLSVDRAAELGITSLLTSLDSSDERTTRRALSEVAETAREHLNLARQPQSAWFESVTQLLLVSSANTAPDLRVECLLVFAEWYYKEGQWMLGSEVAQKAVEIARTANLLPLLRRAYNLLGMMHARTKDIAQATLYYVKALEIAEKLGERYGQCSVLANLADARYNAGMLHDSIMLNEHVIELAGNDLDLRDIKTIAHHNIALVASILQDLEKAKLNIEEAARIVREPGNQFEAYQRTILEVTYTKIMVKLGDVSRAKERATLAAKYAEEAKSAPARVSAQLATTLSDAAAGQTDVALTRLEKLEEAARANEPATREVLEVGVLVNAYAGRKAGLQHYGERYLMHLAKWQRKIAIQQVAALKRTFRKKGPLSEEDLLSLPEEIRGRFSPDDDTTRWDGFRTRMEMLAVLAELRDDVTGEHSFRVGRMSRLLADRIGFDKEYVALVELAARLHDIGKLAVPDVILLKRAKLLKEETEVMRRHANEGCQILLDVLSDVQLDMAKSRDRESFRMAAEIALHHHEWWDGTGYPRGVHGENIPSPARITALADVFDALTHERPYKKAWPIEAAIAEILSLSGKQFEPVLCMRFLDLVRELHAEHGSDLDSFLATDARTSPLVDANRTAIRVVERVLQEHRASVIVSQARL